MARALLASGLALWTMTGAAFSADSSSLFTVRWGEAPGSVTESITTTSPEPWTGPSALRVGDDGNLYLLDTLGAKVERFAPGGALIRTYRYPSVDQFDANVTCPDFALGPKGQVYVLDPAHRLVYELTYDAVTPTIHRVPGRPNATAMLRSIECDAQGRLYVFDAYDGSLTRFSAEGTDVATGADDLAAQGVLTPDGRFLGALCPSKDSYKAFEVRSVDPFGGASKVVAKLTSAEEPAAVVVRGVDRRGRIYVEFSYGFEEEKSRHVVRVLGPTGQQVGEFRIPRSPLKLPMVRPRAVSPDGGLWAARARKAGLVLSRHAPVDR